MWARISNCSLRFVIQVNINQKQGFPSVNVLCSNIVWVCYVFVTVNYVNNTNASYWSSHSCSAKRLSFLYPVVYDIEYPTKLRETALHSTILYSMPSRTRFFSICIPHFLFISTHSVALMKKQTKNEVNEIAIIVRLNSMFCSNRIFIYIYLYACIYLGLIVYVNYKL